MKSLLAIAMSTLVLGLVACGGDNKSNSSTQGANAQGTTQTGATTTADKSKSKSGSKGRSRHRSKSKSKSASGGSSKSKSGSSGSSGKSPSGVDPYSNTVPDVPTSNNQKRSKKTGLYTQQDASNLSSQLVARRVCKGFLPNQTAKDLKSGKTTNQKVAKAYAKGWPAAKRDSAYKGCLEGLRAR